MDNEIIERIKLLKTKRDTIKDELSTARANLKHFEGQLASLEEEVSTKFGISLSEAESFLEQKKSEVEEMLASAEEKLSSIKVD